MVQAVAQRLALSLENARLYEATLQAAAQEQRINDIAARFQSVATVDELLRITLAELSETLGAERGSIRLGRFTRLSLAGSDRSPRERMMTCNVSTTTDRTTGQATGKTEAPPMNNAPRRRFFSLRYNYVNPTHAPACAGSDFYDLGGDHVHRAVHRRDGLVWRWCSVGNTQLVVPPELVIAGAGAAGDLRADPARQAGRGDLDVHRPDAGSVRAGDGDCGRSGRAVCADAAADRGGTAAQPTQLNPDHCDFRVSR